MEIAKEEVTSSQVSLYLPCNPNLLMEDFGDGYFQLLKEEMDESLLPYIYLVIPNINLTVNLSNYNIRFAI